jgi:hypothetical protein
VHGGAGQAHGEQGLDLHAQAADHAADDAHAAGIGDPQVIAVQGLATGRLQRRIDLRPGPEHQHETHSQAREQGHVVDDVLEVRIRDRLAAQHQHEGAIAVGIDVGR